MIELKIGIGYTVHSLLAYKLDIKETVVNIIYNSEGEFEKLYKALQEKGYEDLADYLSEENVDLTDYIDLDLENAYISSADTIDGFIEFVIPYTFNEEKANEDLM